MALAFLHVIGPGRLLDELVLEQFALVFEEINSCSLFIALRRIVIKHLPRRMCLSFALEYSIFKVRAVLWLVILYLPLKL